MLHVFIVGAEVECKYIYPSVVLKYFSFTSNSLYFGRNIVLPPNCIYLKAVVTSSSADEIQKLKILKIQ